MSSLPTRVARTVWEIVIVVPFVLLCMAWMSIVAIGLIDSDLIGRIRPELDRILILLLIACFGSFGVGLLGFGATRGRRPPR